MGFAWCILRTPHNTDQMNGISDSNQDIFWPQSEEGVFLKFWGFTRTSSASPFKLNPAVGRQENAGVYHEEHEGHEGKAFREPPSSR